MSDAQRHVCTMYLGGFPGQLVSGLIWLASAALATWGSHAPGIWTLVLGGMLIFPLAQPVLKLMGRPATHAHAGWFYPAFMIVVGAHHLPFIHLDGMRMFGVLKAILPAGALVFAHLEAAPFAAAGWFTGATLVAFAFVGRAVAERADRA